MVINGKEYKARPMDFNAACALESIGFSLIDFSGKELLSAARAYAALCMGVSVDEAGREINEHITSGGSLEAIYDAFNKAVDESGFFRAMERENTQEAPEPDPEKPKAKRAKEKA